MGTYTEDELKSIHRLSSRNHDLLFKSGKCACFSCLARLHFDDIVEWLDDHPNKTAVCPKCSVDSIVPGEKVDDDLLKAMQTEYFC
jgi:hypothetical protein